MSNPLLEPIHGISLYDYAAGSAKMANGISQDDIIKALGVEKAVYEEASTLWVARMQQDSSFEVVTVFGQYFGEAENHPKLKNLKPSSNGEANVNLEKLKTDRHFYEELCGARIAAYEYGYDGAQWILDNFGIALGDFQSVAVKWADVQNKEINDNHENVHYWVDYQLQKKQEYAAKFAQEQGGNIADDIDF